MSPTIAILRSQLIRERDNLRSMAAVVRVHGALRMRDSAHRSGIAREYFDFCRWSEAALEARANEIEITMKGLDEMEKGSTP